MAISQEAFITEVQSADSNYLPSPEVLRQMSGLSLGLVYGPAGSGKSTVMAETGLPRVVSDTIRPPRINDGVLEQDGVEYFFRGHDLDEVIADVHAGRFVQMALGPSGSSFYASRAAVIHLLGRQSWMLLARLSPKWRHYRLVASLLPLL